MTPHVTKDFGPGGIVAYIDKKLEERAALERQLRRENRTAAKAAKLAEQDKTKANVHAPNIEDVREHQ